MIDAEKRLRWKFWASLILSCVLTVVAGYLFVKGEEVSRILFIWGLAQALLAGLFYWLLQRRIRRRAG